MNSNAVATRLYVKTGVNEFQDEEAIVPWAAAHAAARPGLFDLVGGVNVASGGQQLGIGDDLTALVTQLCFAAPAAVARGETAAFDLVNDPEHYTLRREGDRGRDCRHVDRDHPLPGGRVAGGAGGLRRALYGAAGTGLGGRTGPARPARRPQRGGRGGARGARGGGAGRLTALPDLRGSAALGIVRAAAPPAVPGARQLEQIDELPPVSAYRAPEVAPDPCRAACRSAAMRRSRCRR